MEIKAKTEKTKITETAGSTVCKFKEPLDEPKIKTRQKETFQELMNRRCAENRDEIYGWFNLVDDAKKVGLELNIDIFSLGRVPNGFFAKGNAKYEGVAQVFTITLAPGLFLASSKSNDKGMKILEGFAKLFMQKPDLVYKDNKHGHGLIYTAEWYIGMSEENKRKMLEEARNDSEYETIV